MVLYRGLLIKRILTRERYNCSSTMVTIAIVVVIVTMVTLAMVAEFPKTN